MPPVFITLSLFLFVLLQRQGATGAGGDQAFLAVVVHVLDQRLETLVHQLALHLARRRHRLAFLFRVERLGQNAEAFDLLNSRERRIGLVDLGFDKALNAWVRG